MTRRTTIFSRLALLLIAPIVSAQWAYPNENQCTSPNGLPGTCINIKSCPSMVRLLQQQPIPPTTLQFLQSSQCGYEGNNPKVCCESNNGGQGTNTPTQGPPTTGTQSPPDVTNHPNLRLLPSNCGPILRDKIIGGQEAALYQFPWMALLAYNVGKPTPEFRCGGSVISSRYILTAAHCVTNLPSNLKLVGVRVGEHDITTDRDCVTKKDGTTECATDLHQDFGIEEVKFHSEYSRTSLHNDVAVIRVNRDINFRPSNAKAICLPIGTAANYPGKKLTVAGWGVTEQRISSPVLMQVTLTRFSQEECTRVYQRQTEIWYKQMCMGGEQGKDSCNGDSGGPLAAPTVYNGLNKYVQFGIVSFGVRNCGTEGFPGVYTRVDYYLDWILNSMRA